MTAPAPYRVLIIGTPDWDDASAFNRALADAIRPIPADVEVIIVHGGCSSGADRMADDWARTYGAMPERHPAQDFGPWPGAGLRRDRYMVGLGADLVLAFIGPCSSPRCRRPEPHPSHGASGCADMAEQAGIPTRRRYL
ncbi:SLOG family protein [Streptomyces sp. NPDC096068]|uniref:SLOG family protein n=1 Tax=Streptomyces sp. NPDC096068 TaxID=3155424 RepID=UPI003320CF12